MITSQVIHELEQELQRFQKRLKALKDSAKTYKPEGKGLIPVYYFGGVESAALKRSSMDLTRMLTKLRKPQS